MRALASVGASPEVSVARVSDTVRIGGVEVSARWLRDHGDDPASVDPASRQRLVDTFAIPRDVTAVSVTERDGWATVAWTDGATTTHDIATLHLVAANRRGPVPSHDPVGGGARATFDPGVELWSQPPVDRVTFPFAVIDDDGAWVEALTHLRSHGWVRFDDAPLGPASVERLARRVGYVRTSIFGGVWDMNTGGDDHRDSAYDPIPLDLHTDGTYSHDAPGTIIFAQQAMDGTGGDSLLVDGFAVVRDLLAAIPAAVDLLSRYEIRGRYVEPGVSLIADRVPIRVDRDRVVQQVTFNNYDRAPVLPIDDIVDDVLDAYAALHSVMCEPMRALRLPWRPGRVVLFDNWRLLHGRSGYTGDRRFLGCYTNHEDLESAYRLAAH